MVVRQGRRNTSDCFYPVNTLFRNSSGLIRVWPSVTNRLAIHKWAFEIQTTKPPLRATIFLNFKQKTSTGESHFLQVAVLGTTTEWLRARVVLQRSTGIMYSIPQNVKAIGYSESSVNDLSRIQVCFDHSLATRLSCEGKWFRNGCLSRSVTVHLVASLRVASASNHPVLVSPLYRRAFTAAV